MKLRFTREQANEIFDILVAHGVKNDSYERSLLIDNILLESTRTIEYRFRGFLGCGGKLFVESDGKVFATIYRENLTPERSKILDSVNKQLEAFWVNPSKV